MANLRKKLKEFFPEEGKCYQNAWYWSRENQDWKLVHGLIWNPVACAYMGHAWCEKEEFMLDTTHKIILLKEYFYLQGRVKYTKSYTLKGTWNNAKKYTSFGPWDTKIRKGLHNEDLVKIRGKLELSTPSHISTI